MDLKMAQTREIGILFSVHALDYESRAPANIPLIDGSK
jgi:hypothetical protein